MNGTAILLFRKRDQHLFSIKEFHHSTPCFGEGHPIRLKFLISGRHYAVSGAEHRVCFLSKESWYCKLTDRCCVATKAKPIVTEQRDQRGLGTHMLGPIALPPCLWSTHIRDRKGPNIKHGPEAVLGAWGTQRWAELDPIRTHRSFLVYRGH